MKGILKTAIVVSVGSATLLASSGMAFAATINNPGFRRFFHLTARQGWKFN